MIEAPIHYPAQNEISNVEVSRFEVSHPVEAVKTFDLLEVSSHDFVRSALDMTIREKLTKGREVSLRGRNRTHRIFREQASLLLLDFCYQSEDDRAEGNLSLLDGLNKNDQDRACRLLAKTLEVRAQTIIAKAVQDNYVLPEKVTNLGEKEILVFKVDTNKVLKHPSLQDQRIHDYFLDRYKLNKKTPQEETEVVLVPQQDNRFVALSASLVSLGTTSFKEEREIPEINSPANNAERKLARKKKRETFDARAADTSAAAIVRRLIDQVKATVQEARATLSSLVKRDKKPRLGIGMSTRIVLMAITALAALSKGQPADVEQAVLKALASKNVADIHDAAQIVNQFGIFSRAQAAEIPTPIQNFGPTATPGGETFPTLPTSTPVPTLPPTAEPTTPPASPTPVAPTASPTPMPSASSTPTENPTSQPNTPTASATPRPTDTVPAGIPTVINPGLTATPGGPDAFPTLPPPTSTPLAPTSSPTPQPASPTPVVPSPTTEAATSSPTTNPTATVERPIDTFTPTQQPPSVTPIPPTPPPATATPVPPTPTESGPTATVPVSSATPTQQASTATKSPTPIQLSATPTQPPPTPFSSTTPVQSTPTAPASPTTAVNSFIDFQRNESQTQEVRATVQTTPTRAPVSNVIQVFDANIQKAVTSLPVQYENETTNSSVTAAAAPEVIHAPLQSADVVSNVDGTFYVLGAKVRLKPGEDGFYHGKIDQRYIAQGFKDLFRANQEVYAEFVPMDKTSSMYSGAVAIDDNGVIAYEHTNDINASVITLESRLLDDDGDPIAGALVYFDGNENPVETENDGYFAITGTTKRAGASYAGIGYILPDGSIGQSVIKVEVGKNIVAQGIPVNLTAQNVEDNDYA